MKYTFLIGIDTGTHTGLAVWNKPSQRFKTIATMMIHEAMELVLWWHTQYPGEVFVMVEDPRQANFNRGKDVHKAQGAGSVKRDAAIWDDFLKDKKIPYEMVRPDKSSTKLDQKLFVRSTGYSDRTSVHGRDAAMIVFKL